MYYVRRVYNDVNTNIILTIDQPTQAKEASEERVYHCYFVHPALAVWGKTTMEGMKFRLSVSLFGVY